MTEEEVRREIYNAITMGRDDNGKPVLRCVESGPELATDVFNTLKAKGLLKLDPGDKG